MVMCHLLLLSCELLVTCMPFTGLYCCCPAAESKRICSSGARASALWSEVFLVPSAIFGSIRSPLTRRYGGRSAIFSLSEADSFLFYEVLFRMKACSLQNISVSARNIFYQVNFSSSINNTVRSFELVLKEVVTFSW